MLHGRQVQDIIKIAAEDTTLTVSNTRGGKATFPVPSGTEIEFHVPGLHYNRALITLYPWQFFSCNLIARYWQDPHKFMPGRFLCDWPKDAFISFSQGTSRFLIPLDHA